MTDRFTIYILLAAAALTAGSIYMFDPNAKAATHSQPKFTQMNQPGDYFKPPSSSSENSDNSSFKAKPKYGHVFSSGKTFLG
jgi:hypothetical protein